MERVNALAGTMTATPVSVRRARVMGVLFVAAALLIVLVFGLGVSGPAKSRFVLNQVTNPTAVRVPDLVVPSRATAFVLAFVCALLAGVQLTRGFGRRTNAVLGVVIFLVVFAFLSWADRGRSEEHTSELQSLAYLVCRLLLE